MRSLLSAHQCMMSVPPRRGNKIPPYTATRRCGLPIPPLREHNPPSATLPVQDINPSQTYAHGASDVAPCGAQAQRAGPPSSTLSATSCITSTASLCSSGIRAQHARIPPISLRRPVEGSMRSSFQKPAIMLHMCRISSLRTQAAPTSPSCKTRTRSSLTVQSSQFPTPPQAKTHAEWLPLLSVDCCDALPFQALPRSRSAQAMSTR